MTDLFYRLILKVYTVSENIRQKAYLRMAVRRGLKIGQRTKFMDVPDFGSEPYLVEIGSNCLITTGIRFITHDGGLFVVNKLPGFESVRNFVRVKVGDDCFIGNNCIFLPGAKMGNRCVLGTGSVLNSTMPDNSVFAGVPARYICSLDEYAAKAQQNSTQYPRELEANRKQLDQYLKEHLPHQYKPEKR